MVLLEIPKSIGKHNPFYKGNEDPFFTVLGYLLRKDDVSLQRLLTKQESAIEIGVIPVLLLHPSVDLHFVEEFAKKHGRDSEFGRLARMAISLAEADTPPDPYFQAVFDRFKTVYEQRRPALASLGNHNGQSSLDDMRFSEFAHAYDTYRVMVYNGSTTSPFS